MTQDKRGCGCQPDKHAPKLDALRAMREEIAAVPVKKCEKVKP
jgi:hypothetical protein